MPRPRAKQVSISDTPHYHVISRCVQRYLDEQDLCDAERRQVGRYASAYRSRLADLSWFMKCLNEPIARQANREDNCTGRVSRSDKRGAIEERGKGVSVHPTCCSSTNPLSTWRAAAVDR